MMSRLLALSALVVAATAQTCDNGADYRTYQRELLGSRCAYIEGGNSESDYRVIADQANSKNVDGSLTSNDEERVAACARACDGGSLSVNGVDTPFTGFFVRLHQLQYAPATYLGKCYCTSSHPEVRDYQNNDMLGSRILECKDSVGNTITTSAFDSTTSGSDYDQFKFLPENERCTLNTPIKTREGGYCKWYWGTNSINAGGSGYNTYRVLEGNDGVLSGKDEAGRAQVCADRCRDLGAISRQQITGFLIVRNDYTHNGATTHAGRCYCSRASTTQNCELDDNANGLWANWDAYDLDIPWSSIQCAEGEVQSEGAQGYCGHTVGTHYHYKTDGVETTDDYRVKGTGSCNAGFVETCVTSNADGDYKGCFCSIPESACSDTDSGQWEDRSTGTIRYEQENICVSSVPCFSNLPANADGSCPAVTDGTFKYTYKLASSQASYGNEARVKFMGNCMEDGQELDVSGLAGYDVSGTFRTSDLAPGGICTIRMSDTASDGWEYPAGYTITLEIYVENSLGKKWLVGSWGGPPAGTFKDVDISLNHMTSTLVACTANNVCTNGVLAQCLSTQPDNQCFSTSDQSEGTTCQSGGCDSCDSDFYLHDRACVEADFCFCVNGWGLGERSDGSGSIWVDQGDGVTRNFKDAQCLDGVFEDKCESCMEGYFLEDQACHVACECEDGTPTEYSSSSFWRCERWLNTDGSKVQQCGSCDSNDEVPVPTALPAGSDCYLCQFGYIAETCETKQCSCARGSGKSGIGADACYTESNNNEHCESCDAGYRLASAVVTPTLAVTDPDGTRPTITTYDLAECQQIADKMNLEIEHYPDSGTPSGCKCGIENAGKCSKLVFRGQDQTIEYWRLYQANIRAQLDKTCILEEVPCRCDDGTPADSGCTIDDPKACISCGSGFGYSEAGQKCEACPADEYNMVDSVAGVSGGLCAPLACPEGEGWNGNAIVEDSDLTSAEFHALYCTACGANGADTFSDAADSGQCQPKRVCDATGTETPNDGSASVDRTCGCKAGYAGDTCKYAKHAHISDALAGVTLNLFKAGDGSCGATCEAQRSAVMGFKVMPLGELVAMRAALKTLVNWLSSPSTTEVFKDDDVDFVAQSTAANEKPMRIYKTGFDGDLESRKTARMSASAADLSTHNVGARIQDGKEEEFKLKKDGEVFKLRKEANGGFVVESYDAAQGGNGGRRLSKAGRQLEHENGAEHSSSALDCISLVDGAAADALDCNGYECIVTLTDDMFQVSHDCSRNQQNVNGDLVNVIQKCSNGVVSSLTSEPGTSCEFCDPDAESCPEGNDCFVDGDGNRQCGCQAGVAYKDEEANACKDCAGACDTLVTTYDAAVETACAAEGQEHWSKAAFQDCACGCPEA